LDYICNDLNNLNINFNLTIMKKLFYVVFLIGGISLASMNVSTAQDTKAKSACCSKEKAGVTAMKSGDCPMKVSTVAMKTTEKAKGNCPVKDCPMAGIKACPNSANCPMKAGTATGKETSKSKTGPLAEVKTK
jgi:hypothetical protein